MNALIEISSVLLRIVNLLINLRLWLITLSNVSFIWYIVLSVKHCQMSLFWNMTAKLFKLSVLFLLIWNIITKIHHLITRMGMSYSEYILLMNRSKIIITTDMIDLCPFHTVYHHLFLYFLEAFFNAKIKFEIIALGTLYFHLQLYFLDAFFNARMELKFFII